ncbi:MAG: glycosyltransferase [Muribaculaceae bacterium]|nr:glycosyltransferase [Muribaculaceae bacterium]
MNKVDDASPVVATVILLCYRQKDTIARAIESLLRQDCPYRYEILVADDGSDDGTREICSEYAGRFPDIFRMLPLGKNKGLIDNYFDAVIAARGKYVADCAGDDEWLDSRRLQLQIEALNADPTLSAVCCGVEVFNVAEGRSHVSRGSLFGDDSVGELRASGPDVLRGALDSVAGLPFVLSGALFRRDPVVRVLEENPGILRCYDGGVEDIPLICVLAEAGDVLSLPIVGYRYYIDGESLSNNLSYEKQYRFYASVSSMVRRLGKYYGFRPEDQIRYFRAKFLYMASLARLSGNKSLAADLKGRCAEWRMPLPLKARLHLLLLRLSPRKSAAGRKSEPGKEKNIV